jgi:hypothetical protein
MPLDNNTPGTRNNPKPVENNLGEHKDKPENQKEVVMAAHDEALKDIDNDPELNGKAGPEHDLDEGEIARFEDGDDIKPRKAEDDDLA